MRSKSDNRFLQFISSAPAAVKIGLVGLLAVALMLSASLFSGGEEDSAGEVDELEENLAVLCSAVEGVGECRVMITYRDTESGEIYAVAVLCEGADSVDVRSDLTELIGSLFGIGANRIAILKIDK